MQKFWLVLAVVLLCAAAAFSQQRTPTPDNDVVKISTNLIQVDVTVTDSKGNPVSDLKPDEIEIYENGKRQDVTNFSFVSGSQPRAVKNTIVDTKNAPILPPPVLRPEGVRRTI